MATSAQNLSNDLKSWQERNFFLLNNQLIMSDCSFIVKDGESEIKLPAHKYILGAASWEFYNLFYLMEATSTEIPINDVSVEVVKIFLEFIYKESVELKKDIIWDVLKLADRYSVNGLKNHCGKFLSYCQDFFKDYISVIDLFEKSIEYKLDNLNQKCMMEISKNDKFFNDENFLEIKNETLANLLNSEDLNKNELIIYKGVYSWAKHFCEKNKQDINPENIRLALGDVLKLIRFASMSSAEFTECLDKNSILKSEEIIAIFKCIANSQSPCEFSRIKREVSEMKRFHFNGERRFTNSSSDHFLISFAVNKPIELHGFYLFGWVTEKGKKLDFSMNLEADGNRILHKRFQMSMYKPTQAEPKLFEFSSLYLEANKKYSLSIHGFNIDKKFYGIAVNRTDVQCSGGVKFELSFDVSTSIFEGFYFNR